MELKEFSPKMSLDGTSRQHRRSTGGCASELTHFTFSRYSVACERHPDRNEDSLITDEQRGLAAVFDGVGGSAAGEIASRTAARAVQQCWKQIFRQAGQKRGLLSTSEEHDLDAYLRQMVELADETVRTEGANLAGTEDLATTVALGVFSKQTLSNHGYTFFFAHVGDSRVYLLRPGEALKRLTIDDGLLGKLIENKIIEESDALRIDQAMHQEDLSEVEYSYFRLRGGITQAVGGPLSPTIHTDRVPIYPGDRLLLCTDGVHDNLTDAEIEEIMKYGARPSAARLLVERSLERSRQERHTTIRAKPDDITAIVITCRF